MTVEPALGLTTVIVITEVPPGTMVAGANALVTVGAVSVLTFSVASAGAPEPPLADAMFPVVFA